MPFCSHTIDGLLNFENFGKYRVSNFENFGELEQTNFEEKKYRGANACLLGQQVILPYMAHGKRKTQLRD